MCIKFHKNILVERDGIVRLRIQPAAPKKQTSLPSLSPQRARLLSEAAANLVLASYRNHVLHLFVNAAMVMLSVRTKLGRVGEVTAGEVIAIDLLRLIYAMPRNNSTELLLLLLLLPFCLND